MQRIRAEERGQAAVEFVAILPFLLVATLVAWQLVLVGHVAWLTAGAARSGARAGVVGKDVGRAARSALPRSLRDGSRVARGVGSGVSVSVPVPLIVFSWRTPLRVSARASLGGR